MSYSEKIKELNEDLETIIDFWDSFGYENFLILDKLNCGSNYADNFIQDIFDLLGSTFPILEQKIRTSNKALYISDVTGLLQIFYVHQDLLIELEKIFGVNLNHDLKKSIRNLRNELVGHPVNWRQVEKENRRSENFEKRRGDEILESSVFWNDEYSSQRISYVIYHKENSYLRKKKEYEIKHLKEAHISFLRDSFQRIINKINEIKESYIAHLESFQKWMDAKKDISDKIDIVFSKLSFLFEHDKLFTFENLKIIYTVKDTHPRYLFALNMFLDSTQTALNNEITEYSGSNTESVSYKGSQIGQIGKEYRPLLSKIREGKENLFLPTYENVFIETEEIREEFEHLRNNKDSDLEYYSAFEYLKHLLEKFEN